MCGSTSFFTDPALRRLIRLKLRAWARTLRRRLSTRSGLLFGLLGVAMMALWVVSLALSEMIQPNRTRDPELLELMVRSTAGVFALMVVLGSLAHRGLYLPPGEIERLLAAPIARADLVRYRLMTNLGRSFLFAIVSALIVAPRMPVYGFALGGTFVTMMTLPVLGQATALIFGDAENRLGRLARRLPRGALRMGALLCLLGVLAILLWGGELFGGGAGVPGEGQEGSWRGLVTHPLLRALTVPFTPWASAIAADSLDAFLPWFAVSLLILGGAFELTVRLPVDFRSLSLETSADVARRLSRLRAGKNAISGARVSAQSLDWDIPWLFGRGAFGAVAWLKCCSIARKARATLLFALLVVALAVLFGVRFYKDPVSGAVFIALLGTLYLGSGLRFDFRSDLDMMEIFKAWPVRPWKLFLATILPEVLLLSALVVVAIAVRGALLMWREGMAFDVVFAGEVLTIMGLTPLVCLTWTALDNAVFLFAPVRFVPGHGSAMHHSGRTLALLFLRMAVLLVLVASCGGAAVAAGFVTGVLLGWGEHASWIASVVAGALVGAAGVCGLIAGGGWTLKRFDVVRERTLTG